MRKGVRAVCVLAVKAVPSSGGLAQPTSPGMESPGTESPGTESPGTASPGTESPGASVSPAPGPVTIKAKDTSIGRILVDDKEMTLYLFDKDKDGKPTCTGECATAWPPVVTTDKPTAGEGINAAWLGMVDRPDGTKQVTYHGHPLYHYAKDTKPGDMTGQGVEAFGAKWYVVDAAKGEKLEKK
jgi:predicted lipoprotein with Yx(FWY)xxD motif